jgi:hypothetical protein
MRVVTLFHDILQAGVILNLSMKVLHPWTIRVATALDFVKYFTTDFEYWAVVSSESVT